LPDGNPFPIGDTPIQRKHFCFADAKLLLLIGLRKFLSKKLQKIFVLQGEMRNFEEFGGDF